jgi:hypothetical protein
MPLWQAHWQAASGTGTQAQAGSLSMHNLEGAALGNSTPKFRCLRFTSVLSIGPRALSPLETCG